MKERWNDKEHERRMRFTTILIDCKKGKLLDIGAYKGELFYYLIPRDYTYYPLDNYDLKKRHKNAVKQDLNEDSDLHFDDDFFDIIVFVGTIEHLFHIEKILEEIKRILKPSGIAIISFPNDASWLERILHFFNDWNIPFDEIKYNHHWFFSETSAEDLLKRYFKIKNKFFYNGIYSRFIPFAKSEIFYTVRK